MAEDIGREHVDCDNGACPVDFKDFGLDGPESSSPELKVHVGGN